MWKRLNSNQMCEKCSYKEVFLIKRFLIERFYSIYIVIFVLYGLRANRDMIRTRNQCIYRCNYSYIIMLNRPMHYGFGEPDILVC